MIIFLYCWVTYDYVGNGYKMRVYGYLRSDPDQGQYPDQVKMNKASCYFTACR